MGRSYYSEVHLHLVWHTKHNLPQLDATVEPVVHRLLRARASTLDGVFCHAVGGVADHVHLAVSILPTVLISELVGRLKGASAHDANELLRRRAVEWQTGYGVVSFGTRNMKWVVGYIMRQKEHHRKEKTVPRLERITEEEPAPPAASRPRP